MDFNELNAGMLHRFIEKIEIKADKNPRIHFRFSDTSASYLLCPFKIISCTFTPLKPAFHRCRLK